MVLVKKYRLRRGKDVGDENLDCKFRMRFIFYNFVGVKIYMLLFKFVK